MTYGGPPPAPAPGPLAGRRVLVTRPRDQAADLAERLTAQGAEAIVVPLIRIEPPADEAPLRSAAAAPERFDWIVFSSANGVDAYMRALTASGGRVRASKRPRLCAVGSGTAEALRRHGVEVDLLPKEYRAETVVAALKDAGPISGARVLLPQADIGREVMAAQLRQAGADVTEVVAYTTVLNDTPAAGGPDLRRLLREGHIDVVTFASPSAVRSFMNICGAGRAADLLKTTVVAVIGPVTADAAREAGIPVTIQPTTYTAAALVETIVAYYSTKATKTV
jgi:uroporphyrinogen III methyltransferase/synthase